MATTLVMTTVGVASAQQGQWPQPTTYPPQPAPLAPPGTGQPPGTVPLYIRGDVVGVQYAITTPDGMPIRNCSGDCTVYVYPGSYKLDVSDTEDTRAGKKVIEVYQPTVVNVSPGSKSQRTGGLVMGIVGPVLTVVGLFGLMIVALDNIDSNRSTEKSYTPYYVMLFGGLGMTTAGWIMFGTAGTRIKPERVASNDKPQFAFGAVPTKGGMLLGGAIAF